MTSSSRPLDDVRVLAVEQYGAGPFGTMQLVDLGADVIKIEDPGSGGDVGRIVPPYAQEGSSLFFETFNRGKRSIALNLATSAGREVFEGLVGCSDVVFANVRGDVPEKLGLRYEDLCHLNERIVCCFLTAYGMSGSERDAPGYDYVMQGRAGWMSLTGEPDGPPEKTGLSLVDYSTGLAAALAVVSGVHLARRTGKGTECDLSLFDTAIAMLTYVGTWELSRGYAPRRTVNSAHPSLIPFQNFKTADGWIVVACAKEKFWRRLIGVLDAEEISSDPRFATFSKRKQYAADLLPELDAMFSKRRSAELLEALRSAGVPCGPVNDVARALEDPLLAEREMIVETSHPILGRVRQIASSVRVGRYAPERSRGPLLGEHTVSILRELLGVTDEEREMLERDGAFGKAGLATEEHSEGSPALMAREGHRRK